MADFKTDGPGCCGCSTGPPTTTHGAGCTSICPALPVTITITPQPGNSGNAWDVTTALTFQTAGPPADPLAASALTNAGENSANCWWSALFPDTSGLTGHGFYWVFNCGQYASGGAPASGHLSLVHKIATGGTLADYATGAHGYLFDLTSTCAPFLQTGTLQNAGLGNEKWNATG